MRDAAMTREDRAFLWLKIRTVGALIFALPLFVNMVFEWVGLPLSLAQGGQFVAATIVQFGAGYSFYVSSFQALRKKRVGMDLLVALGTSAAYFYSVAALFFRFSPFLYFETSAVLIALILLGRWMEQQSKRRASQGMTALLELQPKTARVVKKEGYRDIPVEEVQVKDRVMVRPGEKIPVDAVVLKGHSHLDEAMLTGESRAVLKEKGDNVFAGTLNGEGVLEIEAARLGKETRLAGIIRLVEEAGRSRPPIQQLVDTISAWFVPAVLSVAVLALVGWGLLMGDWREGLVSAVAVLVIACPCALGLATPTVITVACARGAKEGILFKEVAALESARNVDTFVVDKTGTVTEGKIHVRAVHAVGELQEFLMIAGGLVVYSEHPLALAIQEYVREKKGPLSGCEAFQAHTGKGVSGTLRGKLYHLGSLSFIRSLGVDLSDQQDELEKEPYTVVIVADDQRYRGHFTLADTLRPQSQHTVEQLHRMGKKIYLLSGDRKAVVGAVAHELQVDGFFAEVLPEEKARYVRQLQSEGRHVGMVGDGVNDAPALATADVGFAIAAGTDIAMESAAIGLMRNSLEQVVKSLKLSQLTYVKIRQNLFFAFIYNFLGVPLAALGLLNPLIAGAAMALSSISVVLNALTMQKASLLSSSAE